MNPLASTYDTTMPNIHTGSTELFDMIEPAEAELPTITMNSGLTSSSFSMLMSHEMLTPFKQKGELEYPSDHLNHQQYSVPSSESEQPQFLYPGLGEEGMPFLNKRKATTELRPFNHNLPNASISNKRVALSGLSPKSPEFPQFVPKNKRTSVSSKKREQVEPVTRKSHLAVSRDRIKQLKASLGVEAEKLDPVRAKLRESLTAALALVSEQKANSVDADKTNGVAEVPTQKEESNLATSVSSNKFSDVKSGSQEVHSDDVSGEPWKFLGQDFQSNPIFPGDDGPFGESLFLRDELLQGNGLTWAMDFDAQIAEMRAVDSTQGDELPHEADTQEKEQEDMSPESVASRIESELFTLFGGVNKKYKEKGRSLLFNLKDRNNPELRERVISGEIPPERLCSMTAEELASKELSQWRTAKAEELDHMKVLPDSELNVRRLVKKTHKGEYQVDFDHDVSVVEDIPSNVSIVPENSTRKSSGGGTGNHSAIDGAKKHDDGQCTITIPGDNTDMLGLMVDDMRDLPPILSLDEFMDSLDKEPPFENLPIDSARTPELDNNDTEVGVESKSPPLSSESPPLPAESPPLPSKVPTISTSEKIEKVDERSVQGEGQISSAVTQRTSGKTIVAEQVKVEYLWEGLLQLTISSTAYVVAIYKSGEKASTKNWPSSFEIKGRVRLDAFDKFLQELPKSRTRATMVVHFALAKRCTEDERCHLIDLVDSYVTDQRLGYAEPSPGVELYMCPPRSKTVDMIVNHLPKSYTENISDIDNGLIGILVWRKERLPSATLPNPTLPQKHTTSVKLPNISLPYKLTSPEEHSTFGRQVPNNVNRSVIASRVVPVPPPKRPDIDDEDDAPPGFGPSGVDREDDDLPEFNFSAVPASSGFPATRPRNPPPMPPLRPEVPSPQLEQMRALIQKYGKSGDSSVNGIPVQPWNDDDDDDIPEWQPQTVHSKQTHTPPGFSAHKPTSTSHVPGRPHFQQPMVPLAKPTPPVYPSPAGPRAWQLRDPNIVPPTGSPRGREQPPGAQYYGHQNRHDRSSNAFRRSRGS